MSIPTEGLGRQYVAALEGISQKSGVDLVPFAEDFAHLHSSLSEAVLALEGLLTDEPSPSLREVLYEANFSLVHHVPSHLIMVCSALVSLLDADAELSGLPEPEVVPDSTYEAYESALERLDSRWGLHTSDSYIEFARFHTLVQQVTDQFEEFFLGRGALPDASVLQSLCFSLVYMVPSDLITVACGLSQLTSALDDGVE